MQDKAAQTLALFQVAVESSYDPIALIQEDGCILYVNAAVKQVLGYEPEEIKGQNAFDFVHPDDLPQLQRELAAAYETGRGEVSPYRCRDAAGQWRWMQSTGSVLDPAIATSRTIVVNSRDVTEHRHRETALQKNRDEITSIWESITDGFYALDTQWRFTYINAQGEHILQRKREELLGKSVWKEFPEAVASILYPQYHKAVAEGVAVHFETFYAPLSLWVDVHAYPSPAGLAVYFHDITDRKQAEAFERASRQFLQSVLDSLTSHVAVLDEQGTIIAVNRMWQKFADENGGAAPSCGMGANYLEVCERATGQWSQEAAQVVNAIKSLFAGEIEEFQLEYPCHSPNQQRWFDLRITKFDHNAPTRLVVAHENVTERKLAEEALAAREAKFRAIFDSVHEAILISDNNGVYTQANPAACELLGRSHAEIVNRRAQDLVSPEMRQAIAAMRERFMQAGEQKGELEFLRPDGTKRTVEFQAVANFLPGQHLSVLRDITERKQGERTQSYFAAMIDSTDDAIIGASLEGVITSWNVGAERMLGYTAAEMVGKPFEDLVPTVNREEAERLKADQITTGQNRLVEKPLLRKDGKEVEASIHSTLVRDAASNMLGVFIVARDITERKHLEENQMRLAAIVESSSDAIMGKNLDGVVVSWNRAAELLYGYTAEEIIGQHVNILVPPERPDEENILLQIHKRGEHIHHFETVRLSKNGERLDISLTSSPWIDAHDNIIGASEISRNISEQKRAEEVQARLATIVESSSDAIISKTLDGIITTWNGGAAQIYGYTAQEVIGQPMKMLLPPDRLDEENGILEILRRGERVPPFETQRVCKDGRILDVSVSSSPIMDASGEVIGGASITRDITAQKQAEAERERFFSLSLDLLCVVDSEGHFLRVNPAFEKILGYDPDTLIGQQALDCLHPDDRTSSVEVLQQLASGRPVINYVNRWRHRDGSYKSVLWATAPYGDLLYCAGRDITDIKAAEEEVAQSLALLEATLESTADGILVVNQEGKMTHVNQQFVTMWRIPSEIIDSGDNARALAFVKSQLIDPDEFEKTSYNLLADSQHEGFDVLHFKDGRIFERYSKTQRLNDHEVGRVWSFRDVTARERAAQEQAQLNRALEQQHTRLDEILTNVPGIVWENSIEPSDLEQRVIYVSRYVEEMLGYSQQEWIEIPDVWFNALHPDDRQRALDESAAIIHSRQTGVVRYRMITKDGRVIWTESHLAVVLNQERQAVGLRGVTMDISERMAAQAEQSRLAALLESTTDLVGWSDRESRVQYINPAGRLMLGLSVSEPIHEYLVTDFSPPWANDLMQKVGLPTASRQGSWSGESALLSRDGREIPVSQVVTAHKDAHGNDLFYSTIARDISESKRVQRILTRANEELEERVVERTEELISAMDEAVRANQAKSEFLSRMSHELRTPMNAILGFAQILEMRQLSPKDNAGVQQILKAGRHLLQLINEVLEISRIEAGRLSLSIEPIEVLPLLREVQDLVHPLASQRQITISIIDQTQPDTASSNDLYVLADRQRLHQVMLNLLSNSIKYNHEGGRVMVSLRSMEGDGTQSEMAQSEMAQSEGVKARKLWRIEVSDTGYGIAPENLEKIFLPFERLGAERTKTEGTGIGLTLAKRLVELMDGRIGVDSRPEQGSTFWIELPATQSPAMHLQSQEAITSSVLAPLLSINRPVTLLYIEDNASNVGVMQRVLEGIPQLRLLTAMQGRMGLELAQQHHPDLLLLDLHLPDLQGDEILRQLRANPATRDIPVIMVSADATQNQINRLLAAGAQHYLTKPLDIRQLIQVIEDVLR